ncbi:hypothetical protein SLEP1_g53529 [Rubroshorea leprosula]|uniref:Uncharacterized protein n=1 Tax=Rubroshorea leprosula TaxID=152421 RepID=A0AAV5MCH2_9ROSI|nr:hypothetical protein SLEP1_g53529 [Rubroshorea leprosula]
MKRQRNREIGGAVQGPKAEGVSNKKSKKAMESKEEDGKEEAAAAVTVENVVRWEEWWPWLSGVADEQMSWGCVWSPFWDVNFVDCAYNDLFSDVVWDDDIWNLKNINEVPKP